MTDIVERLNTAAAVFEQPTHKLLRDAKAEIERLLADREHWNIRHLEASISARKAADEIERLRAALESLTKDPPATLDEPDEDADVIIKMRAIARAALDQQ